MATFIFETRSVREKSKAKGKVVVLSSAFNMRGSATSTTFDTQFFLSIQKLLF